MAWTPKTMKAMLLRTSAPSIAPTKPPMPKVNNSSGMRASVGALGALNKSGV